MESFDAVLLSLSSNELWNNQNWEYSGVQYIKPSLEGLSVKEQIKAIRKYHGRYVEWRCKQKGQEWKTLRLLETSDRKVSLEKNW